MKSIVKKFPISFIACLVASCVGKFFSDTNSSELYTANEEIADEVIIASDYDLHFPKQIKVIGDSLLAIIDQSQNGVFAHIINSNGKYVTGFGKIGQGPGEFLSPDNLSVSSDRKLYIYDFRLCNSGVYHVDSLLSGSIERNRIEYDTTPVGKTRFNAVIHLSDTDYIGFGMNDNCRIVLSKKREVINNYTEYPQLTDIPEFNRSLWNNGACYSVSPDGKYIVIGTSIGMAFEILDISDYKINDKIFKEFYKPKYTVAKGAIPACVTYADDCIVGFKTLCASNEAFYGVIGGKAPDYDEDNIIYRFDYSGKLLNKIRCKFQIEAIDVNRDTIYTLSYDEYGKYFITKVKI